MEPTQDPSIWQTLLLLFQTVALLAQQLAALGLHWVLWLAWAAWWLWGVNAYKTRHVLAVGGWAPAILVILLSALTWSRIAPGDCDCLGFVVVPNFWWQLGYVGLLGASALFFGWLQTVMHWTPHDINLEPAAHGHGHGHDHGHGHGHEPAHGHESGHAAHDTGHGHGH